MEGPEFNSLDEEATVMREQRDEARQVAAKYYLRSQALRKELDRLESLIKLPEVKQAIHSAAISYANSPQRHRRTT